MIKTQPSGETYKEAKKGTRIVADNRDDYVVVSDSYENLAPAGPQGVKREKPEASSKPIAQSSEPLDIPSSPEEPLRKNASKRKPSEDAPLPPPPKKVAKVARIGKKSNLDAIAAKFSPGTIFIL